MMTDTVDEEFITPRMARDSGYYRFELHRKMVRLGPARDSVLYDASGEIEDLLVRGSPEVKQMESEMWDLIRDSFTGGYANDSVRNNLADLFSLSSHLCTVFSLSPCDRYDRLIDGSVLTFTLPSALQHDIAEAVRTDMPARGNAAVSSGRIRFWSSVLIIARSEPAGIDAFRAGLLPELAELLREGTYGRLIDILCSFPVKLMPRCTEEVIANLLAAESEEEIRKLRELKYLQIISGSGFDEKHIQEKFIRLREMGLYSVA